MNVTLEKKDELNATISVQIAPVDYVPELDKQLKTYQHKANIPGFRPGKVPKSMIEKMFGNTALLEAVNSSASKGLFDFIDSEKLNILGQPVLTDDSKIDELAKDKEFTFKFDVGFAPDLKLDVSAKDVFVKYKVAVDDKMLEEEIARVKKQYGTMHEVEESTGDEMVYCSFDELDENGNALDGGAHSDSAPILLSTVKNDEIKKQLTGVKKENELTVNIFDLFENNETEISHVLGIQKVGVNDLNKQFKLVVKDMKRNTEAELNQELFDKVYGPNAVSSLEDFKEKIRSELAAYFNSQTDHLLDHELINSLVEKHNISLPDEFLKRWMLDRHADKYNPENIEHGYIHEAEYLRNHLFEEKVLAENNVKVEDADIREAAVNYTRSMFGAYGGGAGLNEELLNSLIEPNMKKEEYRSRMINIAVSNKVRGIVKSKVTIEEKEISAEEFAKISAEHNSKHHHNHD